MNSFQQRLYLATIAENADALAVRHGLGLEVDEYCTAMNFDRPSDWEPVIQKHLASSDRFVFHAPFNDLVPVSIDPLIAEVSLRRFTQAYEAARRLGINRMVYHTGYIPRTTYKEWYVEQSAAFWRSFIADKDDSFIFYIENVLDDDPHLLCRIADSVADPRFRLCLDIGHAHCASSVPVQDWVKLLGSRIGHLHLHDNDGTSDRHLPLGEGTIPLEAVLDALAKSSPHATMTLENQWPEQSINWFIEHHYL